MRKRKISLSPLSLKKRDLLGRLIALIVVLSSLLFIALYLGNSLKNLSYFNIKDIVVKGEDAAKFSYLKGRNIFNIDLKKESRSISQLYPGCKKVTLVKVYPDRLFVGLLQRSSVAVVKLYRYFGVDQEAVLVDVPEAPVDTLPVIYGLEAKIPRPEVGTRYNLRELNLALKIIKEAVKNKGLNLYKIERVDVRKPAQASFFIAPGLEIKIGEENIAEKVGILAELLYDTKSDADKIQYIDLRFKEPVIKFKTNAK